MKVFKGWYRKSSAHKNAAWHRVHHVGSIFDDPQMASTVCGRRIPATKCDFDINPNNLCKQCEKSPRVVMETSRDFVSIDTTAINTRTDAINKLKRLLKPRTYYVKIWEPYGVKITATWRSDINIDIDTQTIIITKRTKRVFTLRQVGAELSSFKFEIDCLCDAANTLALAAKKKKKFNGCLTEVESQTYFEKLLHEAEKS